MATLIFINSVFGKNIVLLLTSCEARWHLNGFFVTVKSSKEIPRAVLSTCTVTSIICRLLTLINPSHFLILSPSPQGFNQGRRATLSGGSLPGGLVVLLPICQRTLCWNVVSCHSLKLAKFEWLIEFNRWHDFILRRVSLWKCYIFLFNIKVYKLWT